MSKSEVDVKQKKKVVVNDKIKPPRMYKIVYINDSVTTVEFVIETLKIFFEHTQETAEVITYDIHSKGSAVVAVLPYEIAEQKGIDVTVLARNNGFPLTIRIEPAEEEV